MRRLRVDSPRVVFVLLRKGDHIYGGTRSILLAIERLRHIKPIVVFLAETPDDPAISEIRKSGLDWQWIPVSPLITETRRKSVIERGRKLLELLEVNRQFASVVDQYDPDFIHVDAEGFLLVAGAACARRIPLIQHLRNHQVAGLSFVRQVSLLLAAHNVSITNSLREYYTSECSPCLKKLVDRRMSTVYNGLRIDNIDAYIEAHTREQARNQLGLSEREVAVGIVGGITPAKGQLPFLDQVAPAILRDNERVRFYFVGGIKSESYQLECAAVAREHDIQNRITFVGYRTDVFRWYRGLDLVAFPSLREGFGRVAAEAQAFGVPVVASDIVGIRDAVAHGVGGFLVGSCEAMVRQLTRLIRDPRLRERMGQHGRTFARRFDADLVTRDLEELYLRLAGGSRKAQSDGGYGEARG